MTTKKIENKDHVLKYCSASKLNENEQPTGELFKLRKRKDGSIEEYISVSWMDYFDQLSKNSQVDAIRNILATSPNLTIRKSGKLVVGNVGEIINYVKEESEDDKILHFEYKPTEPDITHSGIYGLIFEEDIISELIAEKFNDIYSAIT